MAHLYFSDDPLDSTTPTASLSGDEAHHASQVARLRVGENIEVSDGLGWRARGVAEVVTKSRVEVRVAECSFEPESAVRLTLVQSLAKGGRDEMAVQAATELGVSRVVPFQSERSVSRWEGDKRAKGVARWSAISREAAKQAMRSRIPVVTDPVGIDGVVDACTGDHILILDPRATVGIAEWAQHHPDVTRVAVVVGPEGGLTDSEVDSLVAAGGHAVRLGANVLRTSTAGPAAIAAVSALLGSW